MPAAEKHVWHKRDHALQRYYDTHPERFHGRPVTPSLADQIGISLPKAATTS
ncbi:hypothetical protein [Microbacterium sp. CH12i]|uniref:hypothetical protein n=1 Tax=Microbacterium sp. CH12i TaxID=1479651 RepID=UPI000AA642F5|nr:hypothetical protein [Microbacterium sp. CH12i]